MTTNQIEPSLLVIVPRADAEACRKLQHSLDGPGVSIVVDRRATDRRRRFDAPPAEAPRPDRRRSSERSAALAAGKWIVVSGPTEPVDVLDADGRAILFLYCSRHSVPCERCQDTYRLGWLVRTERALTCPQCGDDLTPIVAAHASRCENWVHRRGRAAKPPTKVEGDTANRQTVAG
jgi:hypothetical protein